MCFTADTFSELHRLPTEEVFHLYLGGPVRMLQLFPAGHGREIVIGADINRGMKRLEKRVAPSWHYQSLVENSKTEPNIELKRKAILRVGQRRDPRVRDFLLEVLNK